jgi:hypothetical protein
MTFTPAARLRHKRTRNSLDIARDTFASLVTGPQPLSLDGAQFPGLPDRLLPLDEVRDLLLTRRYPQAASDAVWTHLVTRSRSGGGAWTVAAVGVAMPGLTSVVATLSRRCPGDPADVQAEVLRGFLEALARVDVARPRIMLRLRWAAYRAGEAVVTAALEERRARAEGLAPPPLHEGHPDLVLARAVGDRVLTRTEADLIGSTRLESVSVAQWAAERGVSNWAAYKARRRAELRLAAYLREDGEPAAAPARADQESAGRVSKADLESGLQESGEFPRTTTSPEVRPCA